MHQDDILALWAREHWQHLDQDDQIYWKFKKSKIKVKNKTLMHFAIEPYLTLDVKSYPFLVFLDLTWINYKTLFLYSYYDQKPAKNINRQKICNEQTLKNSELG